MSPEMKHQKTMSRFNLKRSQKSFSHSQTPISPKDDTSNIESSDLDDSDEIVKSKKRKQSVVVAKENSTQEELPPGLAQANRIYRQLTMKKDT